MERWQLTQMQSLPLEVKIEKSKQRIREWYEAWDGQVYVSFSGGKDSTVLLHIVRSMYPDIKAVYVDTGLEYPEIREFVKTQTNVEWIKPKMPFTDVIKHYGFPIISKEQSAFIDEYRNTKSEKLKNTRWNGNKYGMGKISKKWKFLVNAPFKISDKCCDVIKKKPIEKFEKKTGMKPFIGSMADESIKRVQDYLRYGCNAFDTKRPISRPMGFWTEQDVWDYIKTFNLSYSKIYDMGYTRTGCMFCCFGCHLEKEPNRFQKMKLTHPKIYDYCINQLGLGIVLDYINVNYK
jgi:3'-phosphoadenosine 5'-phosphosulfate sulfotransferase (PAPS reductase)/FAD synthetase